MTEKTCGSINEEGILNDFTKKGFTKQQCFGELIANSIDAKAQNIRFITKDEEDIWIADDGCGMNKEKIKNMFDLHRSNHTNE